MITPYTKTELTKILADWVIKNGKTPTNTDFRTKKFTPSINVYIRAFNKRWNEILLELGYEKYINKAITVKNKTNDFFNNISDEKYLTSIKHEILRTGETSVHQFDKNRLKGYPSSTIICKRFNCNWYELLDKIDIKKKNTKYQRSINLPINSIIKNMKEKQIDITIENFTTTLMDYIFKTYNVNSFNDLVEYFDEIHGDNDNN
jgi:hypothetical protein